MLLTVKLPNTLPSKEILIVYLPKVKLILRLKWTPFVLLDFFMLSISCVCLVEMLIVWNEIKKDKKGKNEKFIARKQEGKQEKVEWFKSRDHL